MAYLCMGLATIACLGVTPAWGQGPEDAHSLCLPAGPPPEGGYERYVGGIQGRGYKVIAGVPAYLWRHGCAPTSGGMVIGYWDRQGFTGLIPGDASTQTYEVNQTIATGEGPGTHYSDYCEPCDDCYQNCDPGDDWHGCDPGPLLPDMSETGGAHPDDCLGDFMRTSWSAALMHYGWTWLSDVDAGLMEYTNEYVSNVYGAEYHASAWNAPWADFAWDDFVAEIDADRPMILLVDSDGDSETDHFVTAIGYSDSNGYPEYACFDTWNTGVRWERFRAMSSEYEWGIAAATYFHIVTLGTSITLPCVADTWVFNDDPGSPGGGADPTLVAGQDVFDYVSVLRFSLSDLPDSGMVELTGATLYVYCDSATSGPPNQLQVWRYTAPWDEYLMSYDDYAPGGVPNIDLPGDVFSAGPGSWVPIDVTEYVDSWWHDTAPNDGLVLRSGPENPIPGWAIFFSREYFDSNYHPIIEVTYVPIFDEALSRVITVLNLAELEPVFDEALSRAPSVLNDIEEEANFTEAISRAPSLINAAEEDPTFDEALSRAVTARNDVEFEPSFDEGISRSVTGINLVIDLDADGDVDVDDFVVFMSCLSGPGVPPPTDCDGADVDADGDVDLRDCAAFQFWFTGSDE
jgi:hypothetical protein